ATLLSPRIVLLAAVFTFAAICWLNCVAIETWEDREADQEIVHTILSNTSPNSEAQQSKGLTHHLGSRLIVFAATIGFLGLATTILAVRSPFYPIFFAVAISAGLFLGLIHNSERFSALSLRIAADAALLTPLLFVFVR